MKLRYDMWPSYTPLTDEEREHLAEEDQTRFENDADSWRKGEDK